MFAIKIEQPAGHPKAAGAYVAELLRHAADRVETQQVIDEHFNHRHPAGHIMYEWTTATVEPPPIEPPITRR